MYTELSTLSASIYTLGDKSIEHVYVDIIQSPFFNDNIFIEKLFNFFIQAYNTRPISQYSLNELYLKLHNFQKDKSLYFKDQLKSSILSRSNFKQIKMFINLTRLLKFAFENGVFNDEEIISIIAFFKTNSDEPVYILEHFILASTFIDLIRYKKYYQVHLKDFIQAYMDILNIQEGEHEFFWFKEEKRDQLLNFYYLEDTLSYAIRYDLLELFINLLNSRIGQESNVNLLCSPFDPLFNLSIMSIPEFAALCGSVKIFRHLILNQLINVKDMNRLWEYIIIGGSLEIIRLCDQEKLNLKKSLMCVIENGVPEIFEWCLVNYKFDTLEIGNALVMAMKYNRYDLVQIAIDLGIDCNIQNSIGQTIFHVAASELTAAEFARDLGCNPNIEDIIKMTPFLIACNSPGVDKVRLVANIEGVNFDAKNNEGYTALDCAVVHGDVDTIRFLLNEVKITADAKSFFLACVRTDLDIVKVLLNYFGDDVIYSRNENNQTALMCSFTSLNPEITKLLLEKSDMKHIQECYDYAIDNSEIEEAVLALIDVAGAEWIDYNRFRALVDKDYDKALQRIDWNKRNHFYFKLNKYVD